MRDVPAPLVPPEVDCTDLDAFMLNVERLMASELVALSTHEVIGAALLLWCRAWKQRPAASLPDDERVLAAYSRLTIQRFRKLRSEVMRGFVKCSDGRFYHAVLAEVAIRAFGAKTTHRKRREMDAERLRKWREQRDGNAGETRFVQEGREGKGREGKKEEEKEAAPAPPNGANAPQTPRPKCVEPGPEDVKSAIFGAGLSWLIRNTGANEPSCRSFLGSLIGQHGEITTATALLAAERAKPVDPRSWLKRNIGATNGQRPRNDQAQSDHGLSPELAGISAALARRSVQPG